MKQTTLKRSAYAALGIPVDLANKLRDRVSSTRETIDVARERMTERTQAIVEEWADEGQRLIGTISERSSDFRESTDETVQALKDKTDDATAVARSVGRGIATAASEPIAALDTIDGIGAAYAKRLMKAGVLSTQSLVARARTTDDVTTLAKQTGLPEKSIAQWSADADLTRIKGIGEEYMDILNAAGVGSISDLAGRDAGNLRAELVSLHADTGMGEAIPSQPTLRTWIDAAKKEEQKARSTR